MRGFSSVDYYDFSNTTAQSDILDYGVNDLWKKGIDGAGTTVAFIVTNPDPGLQASMDSYDASMNLPPADVTELTLPAPSDPTAKCVVECSTGEDRLDAESIHAMAPYAKLLFVSPPVPETIGMQGWPELAQAIKTIADEHLADVITVSMGDHEKAFVDDPTNPGATQAAAVHSLDPAFLDAASKGVPVLFSAGDCGPTGPTVLNDTGQCTPTMGVSADHPADSPWVTGVGGTIPNAGIGSADGRTAPDGLWTGSDTSDAAGAGVSALYPQPSWQKSIPALKGLTGRQYPDISMDADDGTSQASPTLAGVLALATQLHNSDLGTINPALATLGKNPTRNGLVDVLAGDTNSAYGVTGYKTTQGYDIASGWGTLYAPDFVPALSKAITAQNRKANPPKQQAATQLAALQAHYTVASTATKITVTGFGYVPGASPKGTTIVEGYGVYPPLPGQYGQRPTDPTADPNATTPGQPWDSVGYTLTGPGAKNAAVTLTPPDGSGRVKVAITVKSLRAGRYTLTLTWKELTQKIPFVVTAGQVKR